MKSFNSIRFFSRIARMKITGDSLPLTVILNLTDRCNSACKHCYLASSERSSSNDLSTEQIKRIISDLRDNGCLRISFSGGEPLLREDIGELIDYLRGMGMGVTLNSNGILVPRYLEVLKNLDSLAISLDGRPEHHDILRGEGTGRKALAGLKQAAEAGIKVYANMVLNKYNLNDLDYMLDLVRGLGAKVEFNLAISNIFGEGIPPEEFKPTDEEFRGVLKYIIRKKKEGAPILFSAAAYESVLNCWKDFSIEGVMNAPPPEGMPRCPAGRLFCLIDADGTLWACPHLNGKIDAKNVLDVGVAEAWKTANHHPCTACYQIYHHEFSLLMDLNFRVLWNYFKTVI
ncbi:MAG TPA: radical SAM protein [Proteobacteria bacterium]|nr:radical SAM protein [Pseudomonadota bacterium]